MKKIKLYKCKKCGELGLPSVHGDMCTNCANQERGLGHITVQFFEVEEDK